MEKVMDKKNQADFAVILSNSQFNADTSKKFMSKRKRKKDLDFEINANGEKISVHKEVLKKRCRYFNAMLSHNFNETLSNSVSLSAEVSCSLPQVVDYVYSGKITLNKRTAFDVFSTSRYLRLETLEASCIDYIKRCVDHNSVAKIHDIAQQNKMSDLHDYTREFMEKHFEEFVKHKALKKWSFKLLNGLLKSNKVQVNSETKVIQLITKWLSFDFDSRKAHMVDLLTHVRVAFLTHEMIAGSVDDDACLKILHHCFNFKRNCILAEKRLGPKRYLPRLYNKGIYLFGKPNNPGEPTPFGRFWPADNTYTKLKSPSIFRTYAAVAVVKDKVYLVGGKVDGKAVDTVEVYDPVTNEWSFTKPLMRARSHHCCCGYKEYLFVFGGVDVSDKAIESEIYHTSRDQWGMLSHIEKAKWGVKAVVINDRIFVVSGHEDGRKPDCYVVSECQIPDRKTEPLVWEKHPFKEELQKNMLEVLVAGVGTKLYIFQRRKKLVIYDTKTKTCTSGHLYNPSNTIDIHGCRHVVAFHDRILLSQNQTYLQGGKFNRMFAVFDPMLLADMDKESVSHQRQQFRNSYQCEKTVKLDMSSLEYCVSCD